MTTPLLLQGISLPGGNPRIFFVNPTKVVTNLGTTTFDPNMPQFSLVTGRGKATIHLLEQTLFIRNANAVQVQMLCDQNGIIIVPENHQPLLVLFSGEEGQNSSYYVSLELAPRGNGQSNVVSRPHYVRSELVHEHGWIPMALRPEDAPSKMEFRLRLRHTAIEVFVSESLQFTPEH